MINYNYETNFSLKGPNKISSWIANIIKSFNLKVGEINYVFCSDEYLHKINKAFLNHDTYTDIISFDYKLGNSINGDIYISIDRVKDNSLLYKVSFEEELRRVMIHGILHFCGFKDKTEEDKKVMREKENECLSLFK